MGYFRDDRPLYELVLDAGEQRQLDSLWQEFDFVTHAPIRQFKQFIWFERAEPPSFMATAQFDSFRSEDKDVTSEAKMAQLAEVYLAKAREIDQRRRAGSGPRLFPADEREHPRVRAGQGGRRTEPPRRAARVRRAGLSPAADEDGGATICSRFYRSLREQRLSHEDAIRDTVVSVLMSPHFCYRVDP